MTQNQCPKNNNTERYQIEDWHIVDTHQIYPKIYIRELLELGCAEFTLSKMTATQRLQVIKEVGTERLFAVLREVFIEKGRLFNDKDGHFDIECLKMMAEKEKISKIITLTTLIPTKLTVPIYQRPYTWGDSQVQSLLDDLYIAYKQHRNQPYLLGTIILHKHDDKQEIVDGQQRLTTLSLILVAFGQVDTPIKNLPKHSKSEDNLAQNLQKISGWRELKFATDENDFVTYLKSNIHFLQITVNNLDDAFTFFDSQNSRGKPLAREDLLKAHHLRCIPQIDDESSHVVESCVKSWEALDKQSGRLKLLLHTLLGRSRLYARNEFRALDVLNEFRSQLKSTKTDRYYRLNHYQQPPIFEKWRHYEDNGEAELELVFRDIDAWHGTKRLKLIGDAKAYLPFQLTQALEGGEQMFWFLEKYDQLEKQLFDSALTQQTPMLKKIRAAHAEFPHGGINYLKNAFDAALLFYFDKFNMEQLDEAAVHFEHFFFTERLKKYSLRATLVKNLLSTANDNGRNNPFYLIDRAANPSHLFDGITEFCEQDWITAKSDIVKAPKNGQQEKYWQRLYIDAAAPYKELKSTSGITHLKTQMVAAKK